MPVRLVQSTVHGSSCQLRTLRAQGIQLHGRPARLYRGRISYPCCSNSLEAVSHVPTLVTEKQQLEQQVQQLNIKLAASNGHDINGHNNIANHNTDSDNLGLLQLNDVTSAEQHLSSPASVTNILIIEVFAGSFSAGRLAARLNSSNTGIRVPAYAAVELDPAHLDRAADSSFYGLPDHEERALLLNGSVTDPAIQGRIMQFVQRMLQQSADGSGPVIDGVMLLGGPPCTMYSACMTYLLPKVIEPYPDAFRRKLFASDRVVLGFLSLYSSIKALCAGPLHIPQHQRQSIPSCIMMENPFSPSEMFIKYTPAEVAASNGKLQLRQVKQVEKQNLSARHFLQPYLAKCGGPLYVSLHCWCSYAHLTHPKKPTYIFSDLAAIQDTPCICSQCLPPEKRTKDGRRQQQIYRQHYIKVDELEGGDGGQRATWPDSWLSRMVWLFTVDIAARKRRGALSLSPSCNRFHACILLHIYHGTRIMAWTLRVRGNNGQAVISGLAADSSCLELLEKVQEKLGIALDRQELLAGFPPRVIKTSATATISDIGIVNGDSLTVREKTLPSPAAEATATTTISNDCSHAPATATAATTNGFHELDEDAQLAAAIAASLRNSPPPSAAAHKPQGVGHTPSEKGPAPTSVPLADGSCVVRRVIPSDNSCLFNAVGYVMEHDRHKAAALRKVIADTVAGDPVTYNDGFLDKDNAEYCAWIQNSKHWGGAIELSILSRYYGRQIDAYDIQTKRCDRYGQDEGYNERVMLIYDGLHYDAMAVSAFEGAPEDLDITVLQVDSQESAAAETGAAKLVAACHEARQFTDTANFTLRCGVCQIGLKGEKEAVMHAKETGHQNFVEY